MEYPTKMENFKIPLGDIKLATSNFGNGNLIGKGGFGEVYKGILPQSGQPVAVKRSVISEISKQGKHEFLTEIALLSSCKHKNLVSFIGFCDESDEMILVYEYESRGSLNKFLDSTDLTWYKRLRICLDAAHGLKHLHHDLGLQHRVLHRDIKSSNILLDDDWNAKISDFGLSKLGPANVQHTFLFSMPCGTIGYIDPQYSDTGILTKESDVYSFGVVLCEVLCGRPAVKNYEDERRFLAQLVKLHYEQGKLDEIIEPNLLRQMNSASLSTFAAIAFECLKDNRQGRPTMAHVVSELENALRFQEGNEISVVRIWGHSSSGEGWSFTLESFHKLRKITIDHEDWLYSLIFTAEDPNGALHPSKKIGGWNGSSGGKITEINLDADEEIIGISGTVGISTGRYYGYIVITSLSFHTTKKTHGPFGKASGTDFSKQWEKGSFVGFYGRAGYFIDGVGVYLKPTV